MDYKCIKLRKQLSYVKSYDEYKEIGLIIDNFEAKNVWKE